MHKHVNMTPKKSVFGYFSPFETPFFCLKIPQDTVRVRVSFIPRGARVKTPDERARGSVVVQVRREVAIR